MPFLIMAKSTNPLRGVRTGTAHYVGKSQAERFHGPEALAEGRVLIGKPPFNPSSQKLVLQTRTGRYFIEEI